MLGYYCDVLCFSPFTGWCTIDHAQQLLEQAAGLQHLLIESAKCFSTPAQYGGYLVNCMWFALILSDTCISACATPWQCNSEWKQTQLHTCESRHQATARASGSWSVSSTRDRLAICTIYYNKALCGLEFLEPAGGATLYAKLRTAFKGGGSPSAPSSHWHGGRLRKLCSWLRISKRVSMPCVHAQLDETLPSLLEDLRAVDPSSAWPLALRNWCRAGTRSTACNICCAPDPAMRALEGAGQGALCQGRHVLQVPLDLIVTCASVCLLARQALLRPVTVAE